MSKLRRFSELVQRARRGTCLSCSAIALHDLGRPLEDALSALLEVSAHASAIRQAFPLSYETAVLHVAADHVDCAVSGWCRAILETLGEIGRIVDCGPHLHADEHGLKEAPGSCAALHPAGRQN